jgi:hypothetical protein
MDRSGERWDENQVAMNRPGERWDSREKALEPSRTCLILHRAAITRPGERWNGRTRAMKPSRAYLILHVAAMNRPGPRWDSATRAHAGLRALEWRAGGCPTDVAQHPEHLAQGCPESKKSNLIRLIRTPVCVVRGSLLRSVHRSPPRSLWPPRFGVPHTACSFRSNDCSCSKLDRDMRFKEL